QKSEEAASPNEREESKKDNKEAKPVAPKVVIDLDNLSQRIQALAVPAAAYSSLQSGKTGQIFYLKNPLRANTGTNSLQRYDLEKKKEETLLEGVDAFTISADRKKVLLKIKEAWSISELGDKIDPAKHKLALA